MGSLYDLRVTGAVLAAQSWGCGYISDLADKIILS